MELSKRKAIFVPKMEEEDEKEFETRVNKVIVKNEINDYKLVEKKKREREYQLIFEWVN
jgi:hypothetical protein